MRRLLAFAVLAGFSVAIYAGLSAIGGSTGFPLDDAWIHQTYARNIAQSGQLAYVPGQPSAGSTAPLWTLLIALGHKLNVDYRLWTYTLGAASLALSGWLLSRLSLRLWPDRPRLALVAGLLCLFEWHLAWAAASGMETVLFAGIGLALIERASPPARAKPPCGALLTTTLRQAQRPLGAWSSGEGSDAPSLPKRSAGTPFRVPLRESPFRFASGGLRTGLGGEVEQRWRDGLIFGALGGLLTLARPEGLLLVALTALIRIAHPALPARARFITASAAAFGVLVLPVAWLNLQASGTLFPNTFYAKQQEYAVYFSGFAAWLPRALDVIGAPFIGAQVLLVPGFVLKAFGSLRSLRDRSTWARALPIVWAAAHLAVYAARLPVTYQHGRYLIPVIPVILLVGLHGSARLIERFGWFRRPEIRHLSPPLRYGDLREMPPTLRRVGIGSLIGAAAAFWIVGAGAYRVDVDIIENELVASARWIQAHTPPGALIAAHDIGAIGYFARRPLLDLAGLISPEVIPIIRDEASLLALMRARRADFFAAPPDFYSTLLDAPELEQVFEGTSPFAPKHWLVFRAMWQSP